jgi:hypothetical protein
MMALRRLATTILCILALSVTASAHPGRTDSDGGHYNRDTGDYHYHHGYPEHYHNDGVCPYETEGYTRSETHAHSEESDILDEPIVQTVGVLGCIYGVCCFVSYIRDKRKR